VTTQRYLSIAALLAAGAALCVPGTASAQDTPDSSAKAIQVPVTIPAWPSGSAAEPIAAQAVQIQRNALSASPTPAVQTLQSFKDSDVKFAVSDLMDILRDKRHEGWVLAAYPDPKTAQPLIGAGFSLDLPARVHVQHDPLNPHPFLEPSSAELWQAAGLPPAKLEGILAQFHERLDAWSKKGFRKQIWSLDPQITEDDADALLRVGIVQAALNAKAYCRNFDRLTPSQQMAMTQLVYQMGFNLQEFSQFLGLINRDSADTEKWATDAAYWRTVQQSLVHSQWARLYRARATAVIAMLNPRYDMNPTGAERGVGTMLPAARGHCGRATLRQASYRQVHRAAARRRGRVRKN
jgi:GH24 family phage-related lysozyme (muramidase)